MSITSTDIAVAGRAPVLKKTGPLGLFIPSWVDFSAPKGEAALYAPDSVTWRIQKNPLVFGIGALAATILEMAEPSVRSGVLDHSTFRKDPAGRGARTAGVGMVAVYAPKSQAERTIAMVRRMHDRVEGSTPCGRAYRANDPVLLNWVHATATYGFIEAYHRYVRPLSQAERDQAFAEGKLVGALFGAEDMPASVADWETMLEAQRGNLETHDFIFELLDLARNAKALPLPLRPFGGLLARASVDLLPGWVREVVGLKPSDGLSPWQLFLLRRIGALADRIPDRSGFPALACERMGLPRDYLYRQ